jgi:hypothetical protein
MGACLEQLAQKREIPSDSLLVALVKVRMLIQKAGYTPWKDDGREAAASEAPSPFLVRVLVAELNEIREQVPGDTQTNGEHELRCREGFWTEKIEY